MFLKVTEGRCKWHIQYSLWAVCSNNIAILHRFPDITTFTVHVTGTSLEKSFSFNKAVGITGHLCIFMTCSHIVDNIGAVFS